MNETTFTRQYMKNIEREIDVAWSRPIAWHKIPDPQNMCGQGQRTGTRFVDVVACVNGMFVGMEWKLKKTKLGFPIDRVRPAQIQSLLQIERAGGLGLVMIGHYVNPLAKAVYTIPVTAWLKAAGEATKKSIRIEEVFDRYRTEMQWRGGQKQWDIEWLNERTKKL